MTYLPIVGIDLFAPPPGHDRAVLHSTDRAIWLKNWDVSFRLARHAER